MEKDFNYPERALLVPRRVAAFLSSLRAAASEGGLVGALLSVIPPVWLIGMITFSTIGARLILRRRHAILIVMVVLLSTTFATLIARSERRRPAAFIPLVGLVLAAGISVIFAEDWARAALQLMLLVSAVLVFWAVTLMPPRQAERALFAALAAMAVIGVYQAAAWKLTTGAGAPLLRPESIFANTNNLGAAMLPALVLAGRNRRWFWLGIFTVVLLLTASRSSMIGAAAGAAVYAGWLFYRRVRFPRWAAAAFLAGAAILIPVVVMQFSHQTHGGFSNRVDLWRVGWYVFRQYSWLGIGLENYEYGFARFALLSHERVHHHAHSVPIQVAAEMGIVGLAALGAVAAAALRAIYAAYRAGLKERALAGAALFAAVAVSGLGDYVYWVMINFLLVVLAGWSVINAPVPRPAQSVRRGALIAAVLALSIPVFWLAAPLDGWWPRWPLMGLCVALALALYIVLGRDAGDQGQYGQATAQD